jgi:hypothetical protein
MARARSVSSRTTRREYPPSLAIPVPGAVSQFSHGLTGRHRTTADGLDIHWILTWGYGSCCTGRTYRIGLRIRCSVAARGRDRRGETSPAGYAETRGKYKDPGWAWFRGWPAECAAGPLHRQGRMAFPSEMALWAILDRGACVPPPASNQGPSQSLPGPDAGHPLPGAGRSRGSFPRATGKSSRKASGEG